MVSRMPSMGARLKGPARTADVACFARSCLSTTTDQAILIVRRRVTDFRRSVLNCPGNKWAPHFQCNSWREPLLAPPNETLSPLAVRKASTGAGRIEQRQGGRNRPATGSH